MQEFTVRETNICKGVACLLLLFHHLFYSATHFDQFYHIFGIDNPPIISIFATLAKVCVAIFVMLSGYGLTKSAEKRGKADFRFTYAHFVKLFCQYWFIFVIFVPLGFVLGRSPIDIYGKGITGIIKLIIDWFGIADLCGTATMNGTWWYMGAIITLYAVFPLLLLGIKKLPIGTLIISLLLSLFGTVMGRWYHAVLAWILPFVTGIFLAQHGILDKIIGTGHKKSLVIVSLFVIVLCLAIRLFVRGAGLKIDTFFGLAIIVFTTTALSRLKYFGRFLQFVGVHSANIFMMHTFIYSYYFNRAIYAPYYPTLIFSALLISSLAVSYGLEKLKKVLRYDRFSTSLLRIGDEAK